MFLEVFNIGKSGFNNGFIKYKVKKNQNEVTSSIPNTVIFFTNFFFLQIFF